MALKTYRGSCACKRVTFEADIDLEQGTTKCNCTACFKRRWWGSRTKLEGFRLLSGEADLVKFKPSSGVGGFCKHCGITGFGHVDAAEWNDGAYMAVNVCALDGLDPKTLDALPVMFLDGLHDTWQPITEHTSYL
jgi:hypothetical protein